MYLHRLNRIVFYTTAGCHLCEHAAVLMREFGEHSESPSFEIEEVDISTDERLVELYGIRIPVVRNPANEREVGWPFGLEELATLF